MAVWLLASCLTRPSSMQWQVQWWVGLHFHMKFSWNLISYIVAVVYKFTFFWNIIKFRLPKKYGRAPANSILISCVYFTLQGSMTAMSVFFPLDTARIRLQGEEGTRASFFDYFERLWLGSRGRKGGEGVLSSGLSLDYVHIWTNRYDFVLMTHLIGQVSMWWCLKIDMPLKLF